MKRYMVNEIFFSLQGEGMRAGTPNLFLRFSGCNLACSRDREGFDCDTEFMSGRPMTAHEILAALGNAGECEWVVLTGGEPTLQVDEDLVRALRAYQLAIETNGTNPVPHGVHWITVSPKTAEHTIRQTLADEVKYVRRHGQGIPKTAVSAVHFLISPASGPDGIDPRDLAWCIQLVKDNPRWRLSCQQHKWWGIR